MTVVLEQLEDGWARTIFPFYLNYLKAYSIKMKLLEKIYNKNGCVWGILPTHWPTVCFKTLYSQTFHLKWFKVVVPVKNIL